MPRFFVAVPMLASLALGCAHEEELRPAREPRTSETFSMTASAPPSYEPPPAARPRISQTITLGERDYGPAAPAAPPPAGQPGVNVTVNNNIVAPPVVYGGYGYGGYGYGGYGGARGVGDGRTGVGGANAVTPWRASGWEGAQRTAAPGQTPGVGGNWSPPPSYGPQQMK